MLAEDQLWRFRAKRPNAREARAEEILFNAARRTESRYARQLRQLASQIGHFVRGMFNPNDPENPGWDSIIDALTQHSVLIRNWATASAHRMLTEIDRRDMAAWMKHGQQIGRALREELSTAPTDQAYNNLLQQQVDAISNISTAAAERITRLRDQSREMIPTGARWESIVDSLMEQEGVSRSHANMIARTETARAQTTFTAVRATHLGSTHFQWMTVGDADVRELHRKIARTGGGVYRWDDPPVLDDGRPGLPGTIWNCRCWASPLLADEAPTPYEPALSPEYAASLKPEAAPINEAYRKGKLSYGEYVEKLLAL